MSQFYIEVLESVATKTRFEYSNIHLSTAYTETYTGISTVEQNTNSFTASGFGDTVTPGSGNPGGYTGIVRDGRSNSLTELKTKSANGSRAASTYEDFSKSVYEEWGSNYEDFYYTGAGSSTGSFSASYTWTRPTSETRTYVYNSYSQTANNSAKQNYYSYTYRIKTWYAMHVVERVLTSSTETYELGSQEIIVSSTDTSRWDRNYTPDVTYVGHNQAPSFSKTPTNSGIFVNSSIGYSNTTYTGVAEGENSSFVENTDILSLSTFTTVGTATIWFFEYTSSTYRTGQEIYYDIYWGEYFQGGGQTQYMGGPEVNSYYNTGGGSNTRSTYVDATNSWSNSATGRDGGTYNDVWDPKWGLVMYKTKVSNTFILHAIGGLGFVAPNKVHTSPSINSSPGYKSTSFSMTSVPSNVWHSVKYRTMSTYQFPVADAGVEEYVNNGSKGPDDHQDWASGLTVISPSEYVGLPYAMNDWRLPYKTYSLPFVTSNRVLDTVAVIQGDTYTQLPAYWTSTNESLPTWYYPTLFNSVDITVNNGNYGHTRSGDYQYENINNTVGGFEYGSWGGGSTGGEKWTNSRIQGATTNWVANWSKIVETAYTDPAFLSITGYLGFPFGPIPAYHGFNAEVVGSGRNGAAIPNPPLKNKSPEFCYYTDDYRRAQYYNPKFVTHSKWLGNANLYVEVEVPSLTRTTAANGDLSWVYTHTGSGTGTPNTTGIYRPAQGGFYYPVVQNQWFFHNFFSQYKARFLPFSPNGHSVCTVYCPFWYYGSPPFDVVAEFDGSTSRIAEFNPMMTSIVDNFSSTFLVTTEKNINILCTPKGGNAASFNAYYYWAENWSDYEPINAAAAAIKFLSDPYPLVMPKAEVKPKVNNCDGGGGGGGGGGGEWS